MEEREFAVDVEQTDFSNQKDDNDILSKEESDSTPLATSEIIEKEPSSEEYVDNEEVSNNEDYNAEISINDTSDNEVEKYFKQVQNFEEDNETENKFSLNAFNYTSKEFDVDLNSYKVCRESLDDYAYIFVADKLDLLSKYFVDRLLQSLDPYGNIQRQELRFKDSDDSNDKIDFLDLESYLATSVENQLVVLDLCKFGHIEKEYFLNSFYRYMQKGGNKVKFREMLNKRQVMLMVIAYENDLEGKAQLLNTYEITIKSEKNDLATSTYEVDNFLQQRSDNKIETDLLFISSIFKGVSPLELQELLSLIFDDDEQMEWKKNRKTFLKNLHLKSQVSNGAGAVIEFDTTLKGKEEEIIQSMREEDPFFISEFFDAFENNKTLFTSTMLGHKSIAFVNGFFRLVEATSTENPERLSLDWFGEKFSKGSTQYSINYFFSLASCALQVSTVLGDDDFLDRLVRYFYEKNELWSLFYLVEYFSPIEFFDTFKWYKMILDRLDSSSEGRKLRVPIYKSIQKAIYDDPCKINIVLSWTSENKSNLVNNSFYILTRLASDSVRSNKEWIIQSDILMPFLFEVKDEKVFIECIEPYIKYLYEITQKNTDIDVEVYNNAWAENVNKLFFTKIVGLQRYYDIDKPEQRKIIKNLIYNLEKLIGEKEKNYIFLILLWLMEWNFILSSICDKDKGLGFKRKLFLLLNNTLTKEETRKLRSTMQEMSNILLKLSSLTRKYKGLSSTYVMMRKLVREMLQDMNKK